MALGNLNFRIDPNVYSGNILNTLKGINDIRKSWIDNQSAQAILPYAGPTAAANLRQTELGNNKLDALLPFVGKTAQADLNETNARTGLLGAQTTEAQAKAKNPFLGTVFPGAAGQVQGLEYVRNQYGEDSPQYKQATDAFNAAQNLQNQKAKYMSSNVELKNLPSLEKYQELYKQAVANGDEAGAKLAQDAILSNQFTTQQKNQIRRADSANAVFDQIDEFLPSIEGYAGLAGKANQSISKIAQAAGMEPSKKFSDFQVLVQKKLPIAASELGLALGFNPTDQQKKMMNDLANPDYWDKTPKQAIREYKELRETLKAVEQQIIKTPAQSAASISKSSEPTKSIVSSTSDINSPDVDISAVHDAFAAGNKETKKALWDKMTPARRKQLKEFNEKQPEE